MTADNKQKLQRCINTLNSVQVNGRENLDRMLGVLMTLEVILKEETYADERDDDTHNE